MRGASRYRIVMFVLITLMLGAGCDLTSSHTPTSNPTLVTTPTSSAPPAQTVASVQPTSANAVQPGDAATALQADIQAVETAPTIDELNAALTQLEQDLASGASAASSGDTSIDNELKQALSKLNQAVADLNRLLGNAAGSGSSKSTQVARATGSAAKSAAQSPLQKADSSANPVKDIFDEINTGYDLLEKVVKDIIALAKLVKGKNATGTKAATSSATGTTAGTHHLTIINTNLQEGVVSAPLINCGGPQTQCDANERTGVQFPLKFEGSVYSGVQYVILNIYSSPPICSYQQKLPGQFATCPLTGDYDTTITVTWEPKPNATSKP